MDAKMGTRHDTYPQAKPRLYAGSFPVKALLASIWSHV